MNDQALARQNQSGARPGQVAERTRQEAPAMIPPVDVIEDPTGITLRADVPGVPRDALSLKVEGDSLLIEAELQLQAPENMQAHHAEIQRTHYRRAFTLSRELDPAKIEAELTHGVLRVRIPKAEHAQPRRIEVRVQ